ncbi:helix-turn-helix transcriptional regulator [Amycolatopsis pigmentata]|uniref:DNA-binding response regulator n=1 Tax=Amycolatopsis pigmentata TaxID=450801 RepID=A0ABW5FX54_9PSEU
METIGDTGDVVVRGEEELFIRTAHLFGVARDIACAANTMNTWAASRAKEVDPGDLDGRRVRKLYRPGVLLEAGRAERLRELARLGAHIRIAPDEINETIILDGRMAILAGDSSHGPRSFSVFTRGEVVAGVASLFEAAWRRATPLSVFDARFAEVRALAPRILDVLASGCKDETAARTLGLGLRTYRRRVAELMEALGATSRFQAGARARELGLI